MEYFIGINAGGTKTDFVVAGKGLDVVFSANHRSCNLKRDGIENGTALLLEITARVIEEKGIKPEEIAGVCAGFAGGGRAADAEKTRELFAESFLSKYGIERPVIVTTDALITIEGAFNGGEGMVLIAGTGSILYAKDNREIFHRAGGFGKLIGDEGSGYSIGRRGLAAAAKYFDSRAKENILAGYLQSVFNTASSEALIKKIYEENFEPSEFAPYVISGAEASDDTCIKILEEESEELVLHIKAVKNYFGQNFKICLSGGTVSSDNYFSRLVKEKIHHRYPNAEIQDPEYPPEIGAVLLIKKKTDK